MESHSRTAVLAVVLGMLVMSSFAWAADIEYTVRPGDNPWNLTARYLADIKYWPKIQKYNRIRAPLTIQPGTVLKIPTEWLRAKNVEIRVLQVVGNVEGVLPGRDTLGLSAGTLLPVGSLIRTAGKSNLVLGMLNGVQMRVLANSELQIKEALSYEISPAPVLRFKLIRGDTESLLQDLRKTGGRFEIETASAVAAVRGTEFRARAADDRATTEVLEGKVALDNALGGVLIPQGHGATASAGTMPTPPQPLLAAPDLNTLPEIIERLPVNQAIPALANAVQYRTQFMSDDLAHMLVSDETSKAAVVRASDVPDGRYMVRVRGSDAAGLEGLNAERAITVHARPEPPFLQGPAPDGAVPAEQLLLRWAAIESLKYRAQLSQDPAFTSILMDETTTSTEMRPSSTLAPGIYHWRVAAIDPTKGQGPFSDRQSFRVPPPSPVAEPAQVDEKNITLRWRAGAPQDHYQVQLASTSAFDAPLLDSTLETAQMLFPRPVPGAYYVRVRTIAADGFAGGWNTPQRIEVVAPKEPNQPPYWLLIVPVLMLTL